jgi:hypothetical protein
MADDGFFAVDTPQSAYWHKRKDSELRHLLDIPPT